MADFNEQKVDNSELKSSAQQLDHVLDKIEAEKQIFFQEDELKKNRAKKIVFKDLGWYWEMIRKPVLILAGLEIALYLLALAPNLKILMMEVFDPLMLLVDLVFFGWLFASVIKKKKETAWQGLVAVFLAGFALGFILSIFKTFWIREYWTLFNVIAQPVYLGLLAVVIGLVVSLFVKRKN